ncbi:MULTISPECIES: P63C domain-containing protein [Rhodococcus]|uniref:P63C domain-containing protein n=1 Tax=Rhodococcus rhodochrous J45 TaxID=935266 RepID=A0A562D756_RHORH|nr:MULTISPECIES: P63C domain-containing protein [Rhodococcus]TWH05566.1 P63C domain-containing protein [Rhodococcus rhodochrous J45]WML63679.1 P63C domain-containing protein [Rhodococcus sp. AH-ZY2]
MTDEKKPQARGGEARAKRLSKEERSKIAREAARQRWNADILPAVCGSPDKPLDIGGVEIECYVLKDGTRVVTQASFMRAIGRSPRSGSSAGSTWDETLPPFLRTHSLREWVTPEIVEQSQPVTFTLPRGGRAKGYRAELLPVVCELYLKARQAGALPPSQEGIAKQAEILVRGLARVGIIALVDEATGYQEMRTRDALAKILEAFVDKELQAWVRTFPDDYYKEMFRLRGLQFTESSVSRPQYFGLLTNDIVYKRLAPGVLDELKRVQRRTSTGRPKDKLFQHLTTNTGYPKLREHLGSVVTLMKLSPDWTTFMLNLDRIHPKYDETIPLSFDTDDKLGL